LLNVQVASYVYGNQNAQIRMKSIVIAIINYTDTVASLQFQYEIYYMHLYSHMATPWYQFLSQVYTSQSALLRHALLTLKSANSSLFECLLIGLYKMDLYS